jgi:hypothetical protein
LKKTRPLVRITEALARFAEKAALALIPGFSQTSSECFVWIYLNDTSFSGAGDISVTNTKLASFEGFTTAVGANEISVPQSLGALVPDTPAISIIRYTSSTIFHDSYADGDIGGDIISLEVEGLSGAQFFDPPVEITIDVTASTTAETTFTCAYYDYEHSAWRTQGCVKDELQSTSTSVKCKCNHLTNFAVLLDHQGLAESALSRTDQLALGYITTIGLSISVILMGLVVFFHFIFPVRGLSSRHPLADNACRNF